MKDQGDQELRVIIVDDEEPARRLLRELLAGLPRIQVVAECCNGFEAVKAVSDHMPDILLLDIQMPKLDGFEVVELLDPGLPVIFVTAYDEHALRAFEVHAVDYLLKPFSAERLATALERARTRKGRKSAAPFESIVAAARPHPSHIQRIMVREGAQVHVIAVDDVDFIEARDDAVVIHVGPIEHLKPRRLAALADRLDPDRFVRVHRSFVVNIERIARIELYAKDSRVAILADGRRIPVSRSGYAKLRELL